MQFYKNTAAIFLVLMLVFIRHGFAKAPDSLSDCWNGSYIGTGTSAVQSKADGRTVAPYSTGGYFSPANVVNIEHGGSKRLTYNGDNTMLVIGRNYQNGHFVQGIEFTWGGFKNRLSQSSNNVSYSTSPSIGSGFSLNTAAKTDWLLTLRPRVGYAVGRFLFEASAGLAVTRLSVAQSFTSKMNGSAVRVNENAVNSKTVHGWVTGVGIEYAMTKDCSINAEYLLLNFGRVHAKGTIVSVLGHVYSDSTIDQSFDLRSRVIKFGINYKI